MEDRNELLTPQQIASMLQISVGTVLRLLRSGRLRGVKLGRHWRVRPADLDLYLNGSIAKPSSAPVEPAPVTTFAPNISSTSIPFSSGSKLITAGIVILLLVQVCLMFTLVVMASSWRPAAAEDYGAKAMADSGAPVAPQGALPGPDTRSLHQNLIGFGASNSTISDAKNPATSGQTLSAPVVSPSTTPQPTDNQRPWPTSLVVGNTDGEGVNIRLTPGTGSRINAWPDGTKMMVIGDDRYVEGRIWTNVIDPDGQKGWVVADYLVDQSVPNTPVAAASRNATGIELELLTSNSFTQYNLSIVEGQVRNIGGASLSDVEALVRWYSPSNQLITSVSSLIAYNPIQQYQVSPFKVITTFNPAMAHYTVSFKGQDGTELPTLDSTNPQERKDR
ncbi:MAG: helix-turn-helix domain-containing protein [Chloroflexota bacterium]